MSSVLDWNDKHHYLFYTWVSFPERRHKGIERSSRENQQGETEGAERQRAKM